MGRFGSALGRSLLVHALLVGGVGAWLRYEGPLARGGAGLSGSRHASIAMVGTIEALPRPPAEKPVPAAREGIEVPRVQRELPSEVKNPNPRVEDESESSRTVRSDGDTTDGPASAQGQGGSGSQASDTLGTGSDRSNRMGIYLAEVHRRIKNRLVDPGFLSRDHTTLLVVDVEKSGRVRKIAVKTSSGDPSLDRRAITAVELGQPFPPWDEDQQILVPVQFHAN